MTQASDFSRPLYSGKVRDLYRVDPDTLLLVASDRVSAFDFVLPTLIPDKGRVLNQLSAFWFRKLGRVMPNHLISSNFDDFPPPLQPFRERFAGRSALVRRTDKIMIEAVVRGYLAGSAWGEYRQGGAVCGVPLPPGLRRADRLPEPIFTPATKAEAGAHDENISFERCAEIIGAETAALLREKSLELYQAASGYARERGIIIADTKFEFGFDSSGALILIDEIFTPDSSRFWEEAGYRPGEEQDSLDKQFVRNHLIETGWNRQPPAPPLPAEVVSRTREKYLQVYRILTGRELGDQDEGAGQ